MSTHDAMTAKQPAPEPALLLPDVILTPLESSAAATQRRGLGGVIVSLARAMTSALEWCFGMLALLIGLAFLAALPVLQFLTLGYLLEAGGRIARTGRLREGFMGVRPAARVGSIFLGSALMLLPLEILSSIWMSAELIAPGSHVAQLWGSGLAVLTFIMAGHTALACARGGRLRYFFWPVGNAIWLWRRLGRGGYWAETRDGVWDFFRSCHIPYFFWLGLRGFAGAFLWLAVPVTLLALGRRLPALGFLGWLLLVAVLLYVPFLQVHFAAHNRFTAFLEIGSVRRLYRQAPWAFALALLVTLSFALPLYLLKIELIPREAAWLPSLVFIAFIFPARLVTGWSYSRASRRDQLCHGFFRWTGRLAMLFIAAAYAVVVYFTQYVAWGGIWSLYEQHAFLLPVPFR